MNIYFFLASIFLFFGLIEAFLNIRFGNKIVIKDKEQNEEINYKLPFYKQHVINKINGFYGLIGPDVNMSIINNLFDLFIGDGNIQGVFFDNGKITLIKHFVRTDKLLYEERNGKIPNNNFFKFIFTLFSKVGLLPDIMGLANTALLKVKNKYYALYERDKPYLLEIDFHKKTIKTISKQEVKNIDHISGHSKYTDNLIKTIDYDVLTNTVSYYELNENFEKIRSKNIKTKFMPVVHDFIISKDKVIIMDSPLCIDKENILKKTIPVLLDNKQHTFIHVYDKTNNKIDSYNISNSFYMFHYADYVETSKKIEIYGSLYDELDFSNLNVKGNYRKIKINKETKEVVIEKNKLLEKYDLDFPIKYDNKIVFRNIHNMTINGFVIVEKMKLIKEIIFNGVFVCGEPALTRVDGIPYIIFFGFSKDNKNSIYLINLYTYQHIEIPIPMKLNIGFHSIFIPKPL
jgi:hypothetical protein